MTTEADGSYEKMTVADLKEELRKRGLAVTGRKSELISRLSEADGGATAAAPADADAEDAEATTAPEAIDAAAAASDAGGGAAAGTVDDKLAARQQRFGVVTEEDRILKRKERFNVVTDDEKKSARAARFGSTGEATTAVEGEGPAEAKKIDRAKRFNVPCPEVDEERKKVREERFAAAAKEAAAKEALSSADLAALIKKR